MGYWDLKKIVTLAKWYHINCDHIKELPLYFQTRSCIKMWKTTYFKHTIFEQLNAKAPSQNSRRCLIGSLKAMEKVITITEWSDYPNFLFHWMRACLGNGTC